MTQTKQFINRCSLKGIRLITQLRLEFSHFREHKFKYNFQNCLNPLCSCGLTIESTTYFLLHCPILNDKRHRLHLFQNIRVNRFLFNKKLRFMVVLRLIQKQTRLFLTQPLAIFYQLKDSRDTFLEERPCFSYEIL